MVPVLELLFNLSAADAAMITPWLTHCTPGRSSWGALKGLELAMNHRDERVGSVGHRHIRLKGYNLNSVYPRLLSKKV